MRWLPAAGLKSGDSIDPGVRCSPWRRSKRRCRRKPAKAVALVYAETSRGVLQPMEGIADIVHRFGGLLVLDVVTSLTGVPVLIDTWGVDVAYAGSQRA
jgi:aspartate aminotransferase-like enzyme